RGDLQSALLARLRASRDGALHLGRRVEDFAVHAHGVTVVTHTRAGQRDEHGMALIGADGLWSRVRSRVGDDAPAKFTGRTASRALVPADLVSLPFREPITWLWLAPPTPFVLSPLP